MSDKLIDHVNSIAAQLMDPPMVDEDGCELPDDAVNCESNPSDDVWITDYDRKVPGAEFVHEGPTMVYHKQGVYTYDPEDDVWTCNATGQQWEGFGSGYFWGVEDGDLILGGDEIINARPMSGMDYLTDVLDIEWRISSDKEYRSAELLVSFGGPNIWIDTGAGKVIGAWWGDYAEASFTDEIGLDEACSEWWGCQ